MDLGFIIYYLIMGYFSIAFRSKELVEEFLCNVDFSNVEKGKELKVLCKLPVGFETFVVKDLCNLNLKLKILRE